MPLLNELATSITDGTHYSPPSVSQGVPFLTVKDMTPSGLDFEGATRVSRTDFELARSANSSPRRGDVLFSKDGTVGKVQVVDDDRDFAVLSSIAIIRPAPEVDSRYLAWTLRDPNVLSAAERRKTGSAVRRIILADLRKLVIPLPPLPEQRRIAAILDQADEVRLHRRRSIALLEELVTSLFVSVIGDEDGWQKRRLGELLEVPLRNGVSPSATGQFEGTVLTLSAITRGTFAPASRKDAMFDRPLDPSKSVREGELLICRGNGNKELVGRGEVVTDSLSKVAFPDTMIAARVNASLVDRSYLREIWHQPSTRRQIDAGARTTNGTFKVNQMTLESVTVPFPPLSKQKEFAEKARRVREAMGQNLLHQAALEELFASLQHRAFKGEL